MTDPPNDFLILGVATALGLLVGVQRERTERTLAGVRTFALICLLGAASALLAREAGAWILGAALLGVVAASALGNVSMLRKGELEPGITTEIAVLVTFLAGAMLVYLPMEVGVAIGVTLTVILQAKEALHRLVARLGDTDVRAILRFALITFVVLPVLPSEGYGPGGVLSPRNVWLMVVLVVGIQMGGYFLRRAMGERASTLVAGVLGGLISSTATTGAVARQSREVDGTGTTAAAVLLIATGVMYVRVLIEIGAVAGEQFMAIGWPVGIMLLATLGVAGWVYWRAVRGEAPELPQSGNPAELRPALIFAGIYAAVLLVAAVVREEVGTAGLYAVALVSGLTDMDAITLSSARLAGSGQIESGEAWRSIVLASISNMGVKLGLVGMLGSRRLLREMGVAFGVLAAIGITLVIVG
ncbi:MAG: MgtC/SapB family protein [Phycisphaerales bacterium]|jgi:uncharacterized membrane protein (DUF4010 family)|nr:MgtC/SapB family protein [Phycisphaerales bacterium]